METLTTNRDHFLGSFWSLTQSLPLPPLGSMTFLVKTDVKVFVRYLLFILGEALNLHGECDININSCCNIWELKVYCSDIVHPQASIPDYHWWNGHIIFFNRGTRSCGDMILGNDEVFPTLETGLVNQNFDRESITVLVVHNQVRLPNGNIKRPISCHCRRRRHCLAIEWN